MITSKFIQLKNKTTQSRSYIKLQKSTLLDIQKYRRLLTYKISYQVRLIEHGLAKYWKIITWSHNDIKHKICILFITIIYCKNSFIITRRLFGCLWSRVIGTLKGFKQCKVKLIWQSMQYSLSKNRTQGACAICSPQLYEVLWRWHHRLFGDTTIDKQSSFEIVTCFWRLPMTMSVKNIRVYIHMNTFFHCSKFCIIWKYWNQPLFSWWILVYINKKRVALVCFVYAYTIFTFSVVITIPYSLKFVLPLLQCESHGLPFWMLHHTLTYWSHYSICLNSSAQYDSWSKATKYSSPKNRWHDENNYH